MADIPAPPGREVLPAGHGMVLGMTASGAPLGATLDAVCRLVDEELAVGSTAIVLRDGEGPFRLAAGPSLPAAYQQSWADGIRLGVGAAATEGTRPVLVDDLAAHPGWADLADAATRAGFRACWSVPILAERDTVIGAFLVHVPERARLDGREVQRLSGFAQLVTVAVLVDRGRHLSDVHGPDAGPEAAGHDEVVRAIRSGQVVVHYQPQLRTADGAMVGVEALVRWAHPTRGMLSPDAFLPAVEAAGQHPALTRHVLRTACADAAVWAAAHPERPLTVSVNVTAGELPGATLPTTVAELLGAAGLPGPSLCVEVTEQDVLVDLDASEATLRHLREQGVHVAIDDFGTGHASLTHARFLPLTELKVDRTFVDGIAGDRSSAAVVAAVVRMADALDLQVVAEGVETVPDLEVVRDLGCEVAQGFLWSRAVPAPAITAILGGSPPWSGADRTA